MTEPFAVPTYDEIDRLVDEDTLALRDLAWASVAEVERLRATEARMRQLVMNLRHTGTYLDRVLADMLQRVLDGGAR